MDPTGENRPPLVLLVEDDSGLADLIVDTLGGLGVHTSRVPDVAAARDWLSGHRPDLVLLDYSLPDANAAALLEWLADRGEVPPFLVTTGVGDERIAVHLMKMGARDYLVKDTRFLDELPKSVGRVLREVETERRLARAEADRAQIERRYRLLFETMAQGVVYQDANGRIVSANPAAERILGVSQAEMLDRTSEDPGWGCIRQDGSPWPGSEHPAMVALRTHQPVTGPIMGIYNRREGRHRWVLVSASPLFTNGADAPDLVFATLTDLTDRREVEAALKSSEERLRLALECANEGLWDWNVGDGTVYFSPRYYTMLGYEPEEFPGSYESWRNLLHPDDLPAAEAVVHAYIGNPQGRFSLVFRLRTKEGGWRWILAKGQAVERDGAGRPVRMVGTHVDVTDQRRAEEARRRLEAQMLHAQKLESLGVLAGGIAHDFNNLLTSMLGHADLALQSLSRVSPARDSLGEIERAARRAAELCRQLLAYSGRGKFVVQRLDLAEVVEEMTHILQVSVCKKALLRFHFAAGLPSVEADASQIRQVIMNLVINASEAIGERSGAISITTGLMHCDREYLQSAWIDDELPEGEYVFLEVADTGCGMDAETLTRVFDPFFTTKFTGRGLGLAAVLGIVRGHRGTVKVYSEPGRGTTFKVFFPASDLPADSLAGPGAVGTVWRGQGRVLLVDDEETVRTIARKMLERLGFEVDVAQDGREAVHLFRADPDRFACVLMDLTMPHMDGEEAFREMRRVRRNVRVILSSGYNEQEIAQRFSGKGLAGFVQKPYLLGTLAEALRGVLEPPGKEAGDPV